MADPTRAQFDAAMQKVIASAPEGLSQEQFYALIDKELTKTPADSLALHHISGPQNIGDKPQSEPSLLTRIGQGAFEGAAHPKSMGDFLSLIVPAEVATTTVAGKIPGALEKGGGAIERAGQAGRAITPFGLAEAAFRGDKKGLAVAAAPYIVEGAGKAVKGAGKILGRDEPLLQFQGRTPELPPEYIPQPREPWSGPLPTRWKRVMGETEEQIPPSMSSDAPSLPAPVRLPQSPSELASDARRMYGSEKAGRQLNPANPKAGAEQITRLAPGPSRRPLVADMADLDKDYARHMADDRGESSTLLQMILSALGLGGAGAALSQRRP